jgi:hypothetical protein
VPEYSATVVQYSMSCDKQSSQLIIRGNLYCRRSRRRSIEAHHLTYCIVLLSPNRRKLITATAIINTYKRTLSSSTSGGRQAKSLYRNSDRAAYCASGEALFFLFLCSNIHHAKRWDRALPSANDSESPKWDRSFRPPVIGVARRSHRTDA